MKKVYGVLLGLFALLLLAPPAHADVILFSNNTPANISGTLNYGPTTATVNGAAISKVLDLDTAAVVNFAGGCASVGCLNMSTGALLGSTSSATEDVFTYSAIGSFVTIADVASWVYQGAFSSEVVLRVNKTSNTGTLQGSLANGVLAPWLATALGVSDLTVGGSANQLQYRIDFDKGSGNVLETQLVTTTAPEPTSLILLGTGLLGFARARRKRG